jgi:hypothetical protein
VGIACRSWPRFLWVNFVPPPRVSCRLSFRADLSLCPSDVRVLAETRGHGYEPTREAAMAASPRAGARRNFSSNTSLLFHRHGTGIGDWPRRWPVDGICARVWGAQFHFISEASTRAEAAHAGVTREAAMAAFAKSWRRTLPLFGQTGHCSRHGPRAALDPDRSPALVGQCTAAPQFRTIQACPMDLSAAPVAG